MLTVTRVSSLDRDQLVQALTALTANALRYTPPTTPLQFRAECRGSDVTISVVDRGPGIAAAERDRLFDRCYRADTSRTRATGGSGLGLAIVAAITAAHHGQHGVDSTPGGGATFWIRLPAASTRPSELSTA